MHELRNGCILRFRNTLEEGLSGFLDKFGRQDYVFIKLLNRDVAIYLGECESQYPAAYWSPAISSTAGLDQGNLTELNDMLGVAEIGFTGTLLDEGASLLVPDTTWELLKTYAGKMLPDDFIPLCPVVSSEDSLELTSDEWNELLRADDEDVPGYCLADVPGQHVPDGVVYLGNDGVPDADLLRDSNSTPKPIVHFNITQEEWAKGEAYCAGHGDKHDLGKAPLSLLPFKALTETAQVLNYGREKYAAHNWRKGITYSRLLDAALRHLAVVVDGQDIDPESGRKHLAHAACEILFMLEFQIEGRGDLDDRYKGDQS